MSHLACSEIVFYLLVDIYRFRPCSGKCEGARINARKFQPLIASACAESLLALVPGEKRYGSGARSLWWLAANVAALTWYGEVRMKVRQ